MKLAEALLERKQLKDKLYMLDVRLRNNARVQEGLTPNEDPKDLLKELKEDTNRYEYLIIHINKTNELTTNADGLTISSLIAKRDVLNQKLNIIRNFVNSGSEVINRVSHSEIRTIATFNVSDMQKEADKLSKELRKIDTSIQELNWTTELL